MGTSVAAYLSRSRVDPALGRTGGGCASAVSAAYRLKMPLVSELDVRSLVAEHDIADGCEIQRTQKGEGIEGDRKCEG